MTERKLTIKQERFIDEYLLTGNGTDACRRAGYSQKSQNCLRVQSTENLAKPNVKAEIERRRAVMAEETQDRRAKWVSRLEELGVSAEKDADKLRAIEGLFKAEGWLAPEQKEITTFESSFLADLELDDEETGPGLRADNLLVVDFGSDNNDLGDRD